MDTENIQVSIVLPIYNAEKYLYVTLKSVAGQSYSNIDIICVDDGSTDKSVEIIQQFISQDKRFRLIKKEHTNAGDARNIGLDKASGQFIIFWDADDVYDKFAIEKMLNSALYYNADIVVCDEWGIDANTERKIPMKITGLQKQLVSDQKVVSPNEICDIIFQISNGWVWDKLYKAEFVKKTGIRFESRSVANDGYFAALLMVLAERISIVDEKLIYHRTNVYSSIEATRYPKWKDGFDMQKRIGEQLKALSLFEIYRKSYIQKVADYVIWMLDSIIYRSEGKSCFEYIKSEYLNEIGILDCYKNYCNEKVINKIDKIINLNANQYYQYYLSKKDRYDAFINAFVEVCNVRRIEDYFREKSINRVAIHGLGKLGQLLVGVMLGTNIEIVYMIDSQKECFEGKMVIKPTYKNMDVDAIILSFLECEEARKAYMENVTIPVLSFEDIVYDLRNCLVD